MDYHENMKVVGIHVYIICNKCRKSDVGSFTFTQDYELLQIGTDFWFHNTLQMCVHQQVLNPYSEK